MLRRFSHALVSVPWVYDLVQNLAGQEQVAAELKKTLDRLPPGRSVDVGSSGGRMTARLGIDPLMVDIDLRPLVAMRRRGGASPAIEADACRLPFPDRSFDLSLCVFVAHHLTDQELARTLSELARVTRGALVFADPVWSARRPISRLLWRYDRGRHPRTRHAIMSALERRFEVEATSDFAVHHRYLIAAARPRRDAGAAP